jgi:Tfp pilus assembly protein PilV
MMRLRRGTTIIEIAICMMILGVALPPLVTAFADAARQSAQPVGSTIASLLAIEKMEQIVARRYQGTDGYDNVTTVNFPNETPVTGFAGFNRSVTVNYVTSNIAASGSDVGYKLVRITVSWGGQSLFIERIFARF